MSTIRAIFEQGVFRPTTPVDLPEHTEVEFNPTVVNGRGKDDADAKLDAVYEVLSRRFASGEHDVAERHNEHQP